MSNFKFGSFYGLTAPVAVLSNPQDLSRMFSSVTAGIGLDLLNNLKIELKFLERVLKSDEIRKSENFERAFNEIGAGIGFNNIQEFKKHIIDVRKSKAKGLGYPKQKNNNMSAEQYALVEANWKRVEEAIDAIPKILTGYVSVGEDKDKKQLSEGAFKLLDVIYNTAMQMNTTTGLTYLESIIAKIDEVARKQQSKNQKILDHSVSNMLDVTSVGSFNFRLNNTYHGSFQKVSGAGYRVMLNSVLQQIESVLYMGYQDNSASEIESSVRQVDLDERFKQGIKNQKGFADEQLQKLQVIWQVVRAMDERMLSTLTGLQSEYEIDKAIQELEDIKICGISTVQEELVFNQIKVVNVAEESKRETISRGTVFFENMEMLYKDAKSKLRQHEEGVMVY